jgi:hypothetical protein
LFLVLRNPGDTSTPAEECVVLHLSPQVLDSVLPRSGRKNSRRLRSVIDAYTGSQEASRAEPQESLEAFLPGLLGDPSLHAPRDAFLAARDSGDVTHNQIVAVWTRALTPPTSSA